MAGARKLDEHEHEHEHDDSDAREVYLRDGKTLVVRDAGADQLVEIRSESGMVELRIRLTPEGPVLQMEAVKLQLKASEAVEIEADRIALKGGEVALEAERDVDVEATGEVRVVGTKIHLN